MDALPGGARETNPRLGRNAAAKLEGTPMAANSPIYGNLLDWKALLALPDRDRR